MKDNKILGFIGAGSMSQALIGGLIANGYDPACIWVAMILYGGAVDALADCIKIFF